MSGRGNDGDRDSLADEIAQCAATAQAAIQQLCRLTITRPSLSPADVSTALSDLAAVVGAIPQAATQLGDILEHAKHERVLEMDTLTETEDPDVAIDTARLHLNAAREHAVALHRSFDRAHNETAHIGEKYLLQTASAPIADSPQRPLEQTWPAPRDRPAGPAR